jgi:hypothetical protein
LANEVITSLNAAQLRRQSTWKGQGYPLALSPDGDHIAAQATWPRKQDIVIPASGLGWKVAIEIRSRSSLEFLLLPSTHETIEMPVMIADISYNSDGRFLAYTDGDGVYLYSIPKCDLIWKKSCIQLTEAPGFRFVKELSGEMLVFGGSNGVFRKGLEPWDEFLPIRLEEFSQFNSCIRFSADGTKLAARWDSRHSPAKIAGVWDIKSGRRVLSIMPYDDVEASALALHPSKNLVAVAFGACVRVLDLLSGRCSAEFRLPKRSNCYGWTSCRTAPFCLSIMRNPVK